MTLVLIFFNKRDLEQLLNALIDHYKVKIVCSGGLYYWITLDWNYVDRYIDISLPIKNQIQKYEHIQERLPQDGTCPIPANNYGKSAKDPIQEDTTKEFSKEKKRYVSIRLWET